MSKQYNTYRTTKRTLQFAARCILGILAISVIGVFVYLLVQDIRTYKQFKTAEVELEEAVNKPDPITIHIDGDGRDVTNKVESGTYERLEVSDMDMYILSGSLRTLAEGQPFECKEAVICVILNRMKYYQCSLEDIMEQTGQFDDTEQWYYGPACQEDTEAVLAAISNYEIPTTIFYYSLNSYPSWNDTEDWRKIGDYYFSMSKQVFNHYNCSADKTTIEPVQTLVTIY